MKGKSFWTIVIIAVICIVGWNIINDDNDIDTNKDISNDITNNQNDEDFISDEDLYGNQQENIVSYTISKSGYLVENNLAPITYSLNDVGTLSGFFVLNQNSNLISVPRTNYEGFYESTKKHLYKGSSLPICLDRSKGDKLVVVGGEWEGRSRNEKTNMTIEIHNVTFLGYGNIYMFENLDTEEMDNVNGISISTINDDAKKITQALSGTGISCLHEDSSFDHRYLITSKYNTPVTCGFYEGTEYKSMTVNLTHPFIVTDQENPIMVPVQATQNGYFIIDVSALPAGMYAVDGMLGEDIIVIE